MEYVEIPQESAGIEVDPVHQRLKKLPAVRLKGVRRRP